MAKTATEAVSLTPAVPVLDRPVPVTCEDGVTLAGRLFVPAEGEVQVAIVLHGATAVPRDYYARFASWLSGWRRAAVLIYDYRDCGHSAQGKARGARASMADWMIRDQGAALEFISRLFPDLPLEAVGHSLGGLGAPFHPAAARLTRLTAVASGPAHWSRHPPGFMPKALAFWFLAGPAMTGILGYLPGWVLGQAADLPAPAYWQWRRWCITPGFYRRDWGRHLPHPQPERMRGDLRLVAIADDPMIPPPVAHDLAQFYPAARVERLTIGQGRSIGHLRVFSERCRDLWPLLAGEGQAAA